MVVRAQVNLQTLSTDSCGANTMWMLNTRKKQQKVGLIQGRDHFLIASNKWYRGEKWYWDPPLPQGLDPLREPITFASAPSLMLQPFAPQVHMWS